MKLQSREKRVVAVGLVVALGIVTWLYMVSPMQDRWKRATTRLGDRRTELTNLRRAAQNQSHYGDVRQQIASLVFETPDLTASQRVIPAFINQVEGLGQRRRLQITRYEPLPAKIEDNYAVYSLSLSFRANLTELSAFLRDIQEARPIVSIRRLHISPPGPNAETPELTIELLLSTFAVERPAEGESGTETTSAATPDTG